MEKIRELTKTLVVACKILDAEGIMDALGHFSARTADGRHVLMNGKVSPGQVTEEDIVQLDLEGNKVAGKGEPAKEIPLHLAVYQKRLDVMAIGTPQWYPKKEIKKIQTQVSEGKAFERTWNYYRWRFARH